MRVRLNNAEEELSVTAQELYDQREDAREAGWRAGRDAAAAHVRNHSCVSGCCDAQPSAGEAEALARCIEKLEEEE